MNRSCKTCKHLVVPLNKAGRRVVRDTGYCCGFPIPDRPALPSCVTRAYNFNEWPKTGIKWTFPTMGADCPCYEECKK